MTVQNLGGRPKIDPQSRRTLTVRISPQERDKLKELGFTLSDGVMAAIAEFTKRDEKDGKC